MADSSFDWRDICPKCEQVIDMPADGMPLPYGAHDCSFVMNELVGKTLLRARITDDHTFIAFECDDGTTVTYVTSGDCCSVSWIEHVQNAEQLAGARVVKAAETLMDDRDSAEYEPQEYIRIYGVRLFLEGRPSFFLEFRNASNGYYGGSIDKYEGAPPSGMTVLSEDF